MQGYDARQDELDEEGEGDEKEDATIVEYEEEPNEMPPLEEVDSLNGK